MPRDARYDILFEPVKIGPVTAKNRFYQVPHCNGMGHAAPKAHAAMRGVKAEGGWAVVCTEEVEIHPTGDITPYIEGRLWDERDIPSHVLMTDAVHKHGALAGIELVHNGPSCANLNTREVPIAPSAMPVFWQSPVQARAMTKDDIRAYRQWHKSAALLAKKAGYDIVYVYAGHNLSLPMHFLSRRRNQRTDEYGGSLENRARLLREVLEDTLEAVGDSCCVALRFAVDEMAGPEGISAREEGRAVVQMLANLPHLWDVNVADWANDSVTARFADEGYQEPYVEFVKRVTQRPVVGVGRFTSPDTMVSQIKRGVLDFIGAARPSIADPFLPKKIEDGEPERIRECIGCNICVSGDMTISPIRCTQNPAMGEEWRRGWHPERLPAKTKDAHVLVIGGGPAGLECARALGLRGVQVTLAEAERELGGRTRTEAKLPGLATTIRVRDYREIELARLPNVQIFKESPLGFDDALALEATRVVVATGCHWRADGVGRAHHFPIASLANNDNVFTPDDILRGRLPKGRVWVYDDDHYYMGGIVAELLHKAGCTVGIATPATSFSAWTVHTLEHGRIQKRLRELGIERRPSVLLTSFENGRMQLSDAFTQATEELACDTLVVVTSRLPNTTLYDTLVARHAEVQAAGIESVDAIGDALAPGTIAAAVWSGYRYGFDLDRDPADIRMQRQVHGEPMPG